MYGLIVLLLCCGSLVAGEHELDREKAKAELDRIADSVQLSSAFNLIHKLVAPSVVSIHIKTHQVGINPLRRPLPENPSTRTCSASGSAIWPIGTHAWWVSPRRCVRGRAWWILLHVSRTGTTTSPSPSSTR